MANQLNIKDWDYNLIYEDKVEVNMLSIFPPKIKVSFKLIDKNLNSHVIFREYSSFKEVNEIFS
jgi:hypothetical protein